MISPNKIDTLKEISKEPFISLSEQALKVRRNLLLSSSISYFILFFSPSIENITVLGAKLEHLEEGSIFFAISLITIYFTIYFSWLGFDEFLKWRLRLTGVESTYYKKVQGGVFGGDLESEIDQDTAYAKIITSTREIKNILSIIDPTNNNTKDTLNTLIGQIKGLPTDNIRKFINCFWLYQKQQIIRFALFDYIGPITYSITSIVLLSIYASL